jgi:Zn-dependent M28 family amino/carboxypeptidase
MKISIKKSLIILSLTILVALIFLFVLITNPIIFQNKTGLYIGVEKDILLRHVEFLTSITPPRNYQNIDSLNIAAKYIEDEFKKFECELSIQEYEVDGNNFKNIICSFESKKNSKVVIGAHYDVQGNQQGADDNASGVAGLLELGRLLSTNKNNLDIRVDLVAYTLEEPPFFKTENMGSAVHAKSIYNKGENVDMMISLEMIGYFSEKKNSQSYPSPILNLFYPSEGNFIAIVGKMGQGGVIKKIKKSMKSVMNLDVRSINAPAFIPGIDFSDHLNYWKYGYNAVMITDTSFYRNKNYHQLTDMIETLDFDKMAEVVGGIYNIIITK